MINVIIYKQNDEITAFEISGHANSGPYGYDLVCAAVSAVSFGAVNAVLELSQMDLKVDQSGKGGYLSVKLPAVDTTEQGQKAQLIFNAMIISLQTIEQEYNEFIQIKWR